MSDRQEHWDSVYRSRHTDELSWFQAEPSMSLELIRALRPAPTTIVDVGAGASVLADRLLDDGIDAITIVDISDEGLETVRERLGDRVRASIVVADVLSWTPTRTWDLWHDRAVFHFLTDAEDRAVYVGTAARAVNPGGAIVLGCFAIDGPTQCSGLPVVRYDAGGLAACFSPAFELERAEGEVHHTPGGATQHFTWVVLRRGSPSE